MASNVDLEILDVSSVLPKLSKSAVARRRSKRKSKGGKAGHQSVFTTQRLDYLGEHLERFLSLRGATRALQKQFWEDVYAGYWEKFPWFLPVNKDPDGEVDLVEPEGLDDEEALAAKGQVIKRTQDRIQAHLRYRRSVLQRSLKDPWAAILQELSEEVLPSPPPRKMSPAQLYMSKYKAEVDKKFEKAWPLAGLPDTHKMTFRCSVARECLEDAPESLKDELEAELEAMAAAEEALDAAEEEAKKNLPASEQERAREGMARVIQPMLDFLRQKTGFYLTLIAGIPNETGPREFQLKVITAGKTAGNVPLPWHLAEPDAFKTQVMGSFTRFLSQTSEFATRETNMGRSRMGTPLALRRSVTPFPQAATPSAIARTSGAQLLVLPNSATSTPAVTALDLPRRMMSPIPEETTVQKGVLNNNKKVAETTSAKRTGRQKRQRRKPSTRKSKGTKDAEVVDEDSEGEKDWEDVENENEEESEEDSEEDGEEGCEEDGEEGCEEDGEALSVGEIPEDAVIPTPEELKLTDAVCDFLNRLSPEMRRRQLYWFGRADEYDRNVMAGKIHTKELLRRIGTVELSGPKKKAAKTKGKGGGKSKGADSVPTTARTTRASTRRSAVGTTSSEVISTGATPQPFHPPTVLTVLPPAQLPSDAATSIHADPSSCLSSDAFSIDTSPLNNTPAPPAPQVPPPPSCSPEPTATSIPSPRAPASQRFASISAAQPPLEPSAAQPPLEPSAAQPSLDAPAVQPSLETSTAQPPVQSPTTPSLSTLPLEPRVETSALTGDLVAKASGRILLNEDGWPDWVRQTFDWFDSQRSSLGPDFMSAAEWWTVVERAYLWESLNKGYGTKGRPTQVSHWLRVLRAEIGKEPTIADTAAYSQQWWGWWASIQPDWRERDSADRLIAGGTGPWDALKKPGKNGLRIVLLSLAWWGLEILDTEQPHYTKEAHEDWNHAVKDVLWVISEMATWMLKERKHARDDGEDLSQPAKRRRGRL